MEQTQILVLCSNPEILRVLLRLIDNNHQWRATGAATEDEAIDLFKQQPCKLVLLGSGMDKLTEEKLTLIFTPINPAVKFIQHYGGGSGLLTAEIFGALGQ